MDELLFSSYVVVLSSIHFLCCNLTGQKFLIFGLCYLFVFMCFYMLLSISVPVYCGFKTAIHWWFKTAVYWWLKPQHIGG